MNYMLSGETTKLNIEAQQKISKITQSKATAAQNVVVDLGDNTKARHADC
jgi:hypothetical protein